MRVVCVMGPQLLPVRPCFVAQDQARERKTRTMKTVILIIALTLACTRPATAQTTRSFKDLPKWEIISDSIGHVLELTNEQMKRSQTIDDQYADLPADQTNREKRDKDLRSVLSPSQYAKWSAIRKEFAIAKGKQ